MTDDHRDNEYWETMRVAASFVTVVEHYGEDEDGMQVIVAKEFDGIRVTATVTMDEAPLLQIGDEIKFEEENGARHTNELLGVVTKYERVEIAYRNGRPYTPSAAAEYNRRRGVDNSVDRDFEDEL